MSDQERGGSGLSAPLLTIKLVPPVPTSRWPPRPEVVERLVGADAPVLFITAPAGWGKTSLLAAWLDAEQGRRPAAYLHLEEGDDTGPVFWTYVVAALRRACPELAAGAEDALRSPDVDPMRDVVPSLLNELTEADSDLLLVLDDYHVISRGQIHSSVGYLIDHLPPRVQLAIATRADPRLPLGRLRASGNLMELRRTLPSRRQRRQSCSGVASPRISTTVPRNYSAAGPKAGRPRFISPACRYRTQWMQLDHFRQLGIEVVEFQTYEAEEDS